MKTDFAYNSLHEYLDTLFDGKDPSNSEIIQAKSDYWRLYNNALKRHQRKVLKYVRLSFTRSEHKQLSQLASGHSLKLHEYIKRAIESSADPYYPSVKENTKLLGLVFSIIHKLEYMMNQHRTESKHHLELEKIVNKLYELESQLNP